jgi:hypothetical protein
MSGTYSTYSGEGVLILVVALVLQVCNVAGVAAPITLDVPAAA